MPSTIQQSALALRRQPAIDRPAFMPTTMRRPALRGPNAPLRGPRSSVRQCRVAERGQANARQQLRHARLGAWRTSASLRADRPSAASGSRVRAVGLADAGLAHRVQNPIALGGATALGG
jgi:hypothetical protein